MTVGILNGVCHVMKIITAESNPGTGLFNTTAVCHAVRITTAESNPDMGLFNTTNILL